MSLRLFLDCADPQAWRQWLPSGLFRGITTNTTLLLRAGQPCTLERLEQLTGDALALGAQELHLQAWGADLVACGRALAALAPGRTWVKLPITRTGADAARALIAEGHAWAHAVRRAITAPTAPGTYVGRWQMRNSAGKTFGTVPYAQIIIAAPTVTAGPSPTATASLAFSTAVTTLQGVGTRRFTNCNPCLRGFVP